MNNFKSWKIFLVLVNLILFIFLLLSFVIVIIDDFPNELYFNKKGMTAILNVFKPCIDIGTALTVFLTLLFALIRMQQNERILTNTVEQMRNYKLSEDFKNFFKHREEFREYLKGVYVFDELQKIGKFNFNTQWDSIYKIFYSATYKSFIPQIKHDTLNRMYNFLNSLRSSSLNGVIYEPVSNNCLYKILEFRDKNISLIVKSLVDIQLSDYLKESSSTQLSLLPDLLEIKITKDLYETILAFDGQAINPIRDFDSNINNFTQNIKINNNGRE